MLDLSSCDGAFSSTFSRIGTQVTSLDIEANESWRVLMADDLHFIIGDVAQLRLLRDM